VRYCQLIDDTLYHQTIKLLASIGLSKSNESSHQPCKALFNSSSAYPFALDIQRLIDNRYYSDLWIVYTMNCYIFNTDQTCMYVMGSLPRVVVTD